MYSVFEVVNTTPAPSRFMRKIVRFFPTQFSKKNNIFKPFNISIVQYQFMNIQR